MKLNKPFSMLLIFLAAAPLLIGGCGREKGQEPAKTTTPPKETTAVKVEDVKPQPLEPAVEPAKVAAEAEPVKQESLPTKRTGGSTATSHVVKKGECLWWIAQYVEVYNDAWQWPRIYEANRDQIEDPDLIFPGQVLRIPR
jgi:nucleoid-associated protein YgaU